MLTHYCIETLHSHEAHKKGDIGHFDCERLGVLPDAFHLDDFLGRIIILKFINRCAVCMAKPYAVRDISDLFGQKTFSLSRAISRRRENVSRDGNPSGRFVAFVVK
ncbi:hypothetical protein EFK68_02995 [Pseudomonas aeruginosa]|nr:hypothetical protein EFK68_02995 [Pseudomonas aeruginosa]